MSNGTGFAAAFAFGASLIFSFTSSIDVVSANGQSHTVQRIASDHIKLEVERMAVFTSKNRFKDHQARCYTKWNDTPAKRGACINEQKKALIATNKVFVALSEVLGRIGTADDAVVAYANDLLKCERWHRGTAQIDWSDTLDCIRLVYAKAKARIEKAK